VLQWTPLTFQLHLLLLLARPLAQQVQQRGLLGRLWQHPQQQLLPLLLQV
jgi:hypothetical protein